MPTLKEQSGVKYHTEGFNITSTTAGASANIIYTAPPNFHGTVRFLNASNGGTSTSKISLQFYHAEDASYHYILKAGSVAGNSFIQVVNGGYFFTHPGDKIVAYSDTSGAFDVMISVEEIFSSSLKLIE